MFTLRRVAVRVRPPPILRNAGSSLYARRLLSSLRSPAVPHGRAGFRQGLGFGTLVFSGALGTSVYLYLQQPVALDSSDSASSSDTNGGRQPRTSHGDLHREPLGSLIKTYIVYSMCSIPWLVDYSPKIIDVLTKIPLVKQITEAIVRVTFFAQFVGGETAVETVPVLERLRAENKGAVLNFSAEVDESETAISSSSLRTSKRAVNKEIIDEMIRCIDAAGDYEDSRLEKLGKKRTDMEGRKTWVAIKLTALIPDANAFINFSKHLIQSRPSSSAPIPFPGIPHPLDLSILSVDAFDLPPTCPLTNEDLVSLRELSEELRRVCKRAQERGVVVCVDAEHSWYQPAIEAFQLALMREFNRLDTPSSSSSFQPIVYGTFQAYLRRGREHIERSIRDAEEGGYALGVKLVRGAYHKLEKDTHNARIHGDRAETSGPNLSISPDPLPPVWQTKEETDSCFDGCVKFLVGKVAEDIRSAQTAKTGTISPRIGLIFGTHNPKSCELVLDALVAEGLATRKVTSSNDGSEEGKIEISKEAARRVAVGQLYGMCDALSSSLASRTSVHSRHLGEDPFVMKYVPYGPLSRVMPYLGRRAIENKSVLSGQNGGNGGGSAKEERHRAAREIRRRVKEWFGLS